MDFYRCMNHPMEASVAQCSRCGKPVCQQCYDPETGRCRHRCGEMVHHHAPNMTEQPKSTFWTFVVTLLAILGGFAVLLLTICGAMLFSY
ncbi:hypothetical protein [Paenibacillus dakarensis]|uniref:hypothetical protein n=1 Tax=Paenibacillus dakarensis TaxID=1527293 RepID=UPI0009E9D95C|nr:hypothetical protein [Paenibacillus dakarensis]